MNSELPTPQINPEYRPPDQEVDGSLKNPESESVGENISEREQNMKQVDRENTPPVPVIASLPLPAAPVPAVSQQTVADDSAGPTIASDDDLIEKEWVDKAKKIIADTRNDPYLREREVTKLQIDYLRKRYGKELGTSN